MTLMADLAGRYQRNQLVGQLVGQQQLWIQLESFARLIHTSLNPIECSFHIANEGRRLIECDRVSVANRRNGNRTEVEAVSGCDVVEKRSNQVRLLRKLCDGVLDWGEQLVYSGTKDDSLPPKVLDALDHYLAENPSKLLVITPLHDEREGDGKDKPKLPPRSALVTECFESPADQQQVMARLDVVARHATGALFNAIEHRRIPFRFVWMPLAKLQEGLGGKTRTITLIVVAAVATVITGLIVIPYPLKVDSTGKLMPVVRRVLYTPVPGTIETFDVQPNEEVPPRRALVQMYDSKLFERISQLKTEADSKEKQAEEERITANNVTSPVDKQAQMGKAAVTRIEARARQYELNEVLTRTHSVPGRPGWFTLQAPEMTTEEVRQVDRPVWTVLTSTLGNNLNFLEKLGSEVKPSEPILRLGAKEGPWEIELKIPQKHIGQVYRAFEKKGRDKELDVDFILLGDTTVRYKGKLAFGRIAGQANPDTEQSTSSSSSSENEPVVIAYVRLEGDDIPKAYQLSRQRMLTSSDVKAKIVCGDHAAGYSLFYGLYEFLYEKVVFYLF
jgi:hypothetical protein